MTNALPKAVAQEPKFGCAVDRAAFINWPNKIGAEYVFLDCEFHLAETDFVEELLDRGALGPSSCWRSLFDGGSSRPS